MMPVQGTSRPVAGHSGKTDAQVVQFPRAGEQSPHDPCMIMRQWRESRGWGSWRVAGAMIVAATPEEKKRLPAQKDLAANWRRWEQGQNEPDGHCSEPFYKPIIARMMGMTPEMIWPPRRVSRRYVPKTPFVRRDLRSELEYRREMVKKSLGKFQEELEYLERIQQTVTQLQEELEHLDAMLAVQVRGTT